MVTKHNYFNSTKGTFNIVSTTKIKKLFNTIKIHGGLIEGKTYDFYGKKYELNYMSYGKYGSVSIYFIVDDKQLLRLSDHWSNGCKNLIVRKCGSISSCYWKLQGNSYPFYFSCGQEILKSVYVETYYSGYWAKDWQPIDNCLLGGIINLKELKKNYNDNKTI